MPEQHLGGGTYNDIFLTHVSDGSRPGSTVPVVMRLSYYSNPVMRKLASVVRSNNTEDAIRAAKSIVARDPVQIKNSFSALTNVLIKRRVSPHFAFMYESRNCKNMLSKVKHVMKPGSLEKKERIYHKKYGLAYNNVSYFEKFDGDLLHVMTGEQQPPPGPEDVRAMIFQVLFTVAVLQHFLPDFRHNDLSASNILVKHHQQAAAPSARGVRRYQMYGSAFQVSSPWFAAVYDFDLAFSAAKIEGVRGDAEGGCCDLRNDIMLRDAFGTHDNPVNRLLNASFNPSFDAYYLLWTLAWTIQGRAKAAYAGPEWSELHAFLARNGIDRSKPKFVQGIRENLIPYNLLKDPYFDALRTSLPTATAFGIKPVPFRVHYGPKEYRTERKVSRFAPATFYSSEREPVLSFLNDRLHAKIVPQMLDYMPTTFTFDA